MPQAQIYASGGLSRRSKFDLMKFTVEKQSTTSRARAGVIETAHGVIKTPVFMPVGTLASVKSVTPDELEQAGARIILGNTYHLNLRPGCEVIERFGGLHRFMNWGRPILTDSGGFQVFSLAKLARVSDEGVVFQSHIDGSRHMLTPEKVVAIQRCLGSDIMMCLDQCIQHPASHSDTTAALETTRKWAARSKLSWESMNDGRQALFGIVQGGMFADLRRRSAQELVQIDFEGYAIGGLSVGEPQEMMLEMAETALPLLPDEKPKYIMGVGAPPDLVELVHRGADMFDCVLPTRNARNGQIFSRTGTRNLRNARYRQDTRPLDEDCGCYTCSRYSRAYLRHLLIARELLSYRLLTLHNLHFFVDFAGQMRSAIVADAFDAFRRQFYREYV
jgi:queuine tRNA-ribosyltransferase